VQADFREKVNQNGVKYSNMFDYMQTKIRDKQISEVDECTESEFRECLMLLESEGVLNLVGHRMAPTIRFLRE
jgi:hypothetical protein